MRVGLPKSDSLKSGPDIYESLGLGTGLKFPVALKFSVQSPVFFRALDFLDSVETLDIELILRDKVSLRDEESTEAEDKFIPNPSFPDSIIFTSLLNSLFIIDAFSSDTSLVFKFLRKASSYFCLDLKSDFYLYISSDSSILDSVPLLGELRNLK